MMSFSGTASNVTNVSTSMTNKAKLNELGFSIVDDNLYKQLFPSHQRAVLTSEAEQRVRQHYADFAMPLPPVMPKTVQHDWKLPKLQGNTLREHFETISMSFAKDYDDRARKLITKIPDMPRPCDVVMQPGWTMYKGDKVVAVDCPAENCYVLDCETYVLRGGFPIIAVAVSTEAWYIWLDPALCDKNIDYTQRLYPIGSDKLVIGHNVSYDWQRSIESHWLDVPAGSKRSYFLDTMSMHIVMNGFSGPQRWVVNAKSVPAYAKAWADHGSANSLLACYNFHTWPEVPLTEQDKELRNVFVTQDLDVIRSRFFELIGYAMLDVKYTWELFKAMYPKYRQKRPSWTSLAGVLQQSANNLPVVDDWFDWLANCEAKLEEFNNAIDLTGRQIAESLNKALQDWLAKVRALGFSEQEAWQIHNKHLNDLDLSALSAVVGGKLADEWLWLVGDEQTGNSQLDWSIRPRVKSGRGLPEWFRGMSQMGKSSRLLHQLLKMSYNDKPLFWKGSKLKWAWQSDDGKWNTVTKPGTDSAAETLLTREFKDLFKDGTIKTSDSTSQKVIDLCMAVTYWVSCRGRAMSQIVHKVKYDNGYCNVITPDLVPTGTVSGRGVSPLWLTVTDAKDDNRFRIGVELKSRIQAPPGKVLVQADFSGQELRIGAAYADSIAARKVYDDKSQLGYLGACLMSHGVYAGTKELGNDSHSMLAKSIGISRGQAKAVAYAMLYGAGRKTVAQTIMWDFASRPEPKDVLFKMALAKADAALQYKKGKKVSKDSKVYYGGADSAAFTKLSLLESEPYPKTPLLKNQLTAPLCPANCGTDFVTGRTNWGIQATARDQGDCLTVAFQWLCNMHGINARPIWLYHDELVSICDEKDSEIAAWLLNVAHLWVWAFTYESLEIYDCPDVGKFFDDVIVQKAFRKSHDLSTYTPSNTDEQLPDGQLLLEWDMPRLNDKTYDLGLRVCPELY